MRLDRRKQASNSSRTCAPSRAATISRHDRTSRGSSTAKAGSNSKGMSIGSIFKEGEGQQLPALIQQNTDRISDFCFVKQSGGC